MIAATRFAWALARDGVLPLSGYWRKVTTKTRIPRRATGLLIGLCMLTATTYAQPSDQLVNMMIQLSALLTAVRSFCQYLSTFSFFSSSSPMS